jgi:hypothetical protein
MDLSNPYRPRSGALLIAAAPPSSYGSVSYQVNRAPLSGRSAAGRALAPRRSGCASPGAARRALHSAGQTALGQAVGSHRLGCVMATPGIAVTSWNCSSSCLLPRWSLSTPPASRPPCRHSSALEPMLGSTLISWIPVYWLHGQHRWTGALFRKRSPETSLRAGVAVASRGSDCRSCSRACRCWRMQRLGGWQFAWRKVGEPERRRG